MKIKKYLIRIVMLGALLTLGIFLLNKNVSAELQNNIKTKEILEDKFWEPQFATNAQEPIGYIANNTLAINNGSTQKEYISRVINPDLKIVVLGFKWDGQESSDKDIQVEVRFLNSDNSWTKWFKANKR